MNLLSAGSVFIQSVLVLTLIALPADAHSVTDKTSLLKFETSALEAQATWTRGPAESEESVLKLEFFDSSTHQAKAADGTIHVALWMPDMGHGSSPTRIETALDESGSAMLGTYLVRDIYFIMGGHWQVKVTLKDKAGVSETQILDVKLKGHGGHHHTF